MKRFGNWLLYLLINMLFHWEGSIPAWVLLMLHYFVGLSLWWFWLALGLWILGLNLWMAVFSWAGSAKPLPGPKPYRGPSVTGYVVKQEQLCACGTRFSSKFCPECGAPRKDTD